MLYWLLPNLSEWSTAFGFLNVFKYITFRSLFAFLISFLFVLFVQPYFIEWLRRKKIAGQPIRSDGPKDHAGKSGTPTMGGMLIVGAVLASSFLLCDLSVNLVWFAIFVLISLGTLGFLDDWRKVSAQNTKGVSGKGKILWQVGTGLIFGAGLYFTDFSTSLNFPFFKNLIIPLGIFFVLLTALVVVSASNSVNLTDGLDGLAIGPVITVSGTYAIFAYLAGHRQIADYLNIAFVPGAGELAIILMSLIGAGLGFLWYNTFPAQIFMGDLGALSIGGLLGAVAVMVKQELLLVIAGGIFVVEALSVIIQTRYYKLTKKRIFKMAPIHHHFELKGWAEPKIIVRFWIISFVLAIISLTALKLR